MPQLADQPIRSTDELIQDIRAWKRAIYSRPLDTKLPECCYLSRLDGGRLPSSNQEGSRQSHKSWHSSEQLVNAEPQFNVESNHSLDQSPHRFLIRVHAKDYAKTVILSQVHNC